MRSHSTHSGGEDEDGAHGGAGQHPGSDAGRDKDIPLVDAYTMEQQISGTLQRERMFGWRCGRFGVVALVLCAVRLYRLMSHTTARRTGAIGIRMALRATQGNVMRQGLIEGVGLALARLALGWPLAAYAARLATLQKLLPEAAVA